MGNMRMYAARESLVLDSVVLAALLFFPQFFFLSSLFLSLPPLLGKMDRLKNEAKLSRRGSAGVMVMSEKWSSSKATRALIQEDIKAQQHFAVQRKRQTVDELENGFLVIGTSAITFLAADNHQIIASHPLNFIETYSQSLHNPLELSYTVKQTHFLKKDEVMNFSFIAPSEDTLRTLVREIDRFILGNQRDDPTGEPQTYVLDRTKNHAVESEDTVHWLPGERFVCEREIMSTEGPALLGRAKRCDVLAIFHPRGIGFLLNNEEKNDGRGILDAFSYRSFKTYGAADESTFGFRVPGALVGREEEEEVFVCLYCEASAHLMNVIVTRHAKNWEKLKAQDLEPAKWVREYTTKSF